jgi:hypothetical protein
VAIHIYAVTTPEVAPMIRGQDLVRRLLSPHMVDRVEDKAAEHCLGRVGLRLEL